MGKHTYRVFIIGLLLGSIHALADKKDNESSTDPEYLRKMPHLSYDLNCSIFLPSNTIWQPGLDTRVTALMADAYLVMHLKPTFHMSLIQTVTYQLLYKCSANQSEFLRIPLQPETESVGKPATYCQQSRPFQLVGKDDVYNISLTGHSNIDFDQAMAHFLEFRVLVSFPHGNEKSGSLFVYNLDALAKLNSIPTKTSIGTFRRHILTDKAIEFLATMNAAESGHVVPFLSAEFTTVFNKAPIITQSSLSVTVWMTASSSPCTDNFTLVDRDIVFTSGDPDEDITEHVAESPIGYIEPRSGILAYSASSLDIKKGFLAESANVVKVCLRLALNHQIWNYKLTLTIADDLKVRNFVNRKYYSNSSACSIASTQHQLRLTLVEGMQSFALMNPIVCQNDESHVFIISYNDKRCYSVLPNQYELGVIWVICDGFFMANGGHLIVRNEGGPITVSFSGQYKFALNDLEFTYFVTVLSLPRFKTSLSSGELPHKTYANINIPVYLSCTVYYDGMKQVILQPLFRVYHLFGVSNWKEYSLDEFATRILKKSPDSMSKTVTDRSQRDRNTTLSIELPIVDSKWSNWILAYTCIASVSKHDEQVIGLPYYSQTSTDVVYFGARVKSLLPSSSGGMGAVPIAARVVLSSIVATGIANLIST